MDFSEAFLRAGNCTDETERIVGVGRHPSCLCKSHGALLQLFVQLDAQGYFSKTSPSSSRGRSPFTQRASSALQPEKGAQPGVPVATVQASLSKIGEQTHDHPQPLRASDPSLPKLRQQAGKGSRVIQLCSLIERKLAGHCRK